MQVVMEIPESHLLGTSPEDLGHRLMLYAALLMYRTGELSAGAACEFADLDRHTFLSECKRLGIETLHTTTDELTAELDLLGRESGAGCS